MDHQARVCEFWRLFSEQRWDAARELLDPAFVAVWPQSRERIVGRDNYVELNRRYPGNHRIELVHAHSLGELVITTVWITADTGQKTFATSYFTLERGLIRAAEEYWAEPYPAPENRRQWVQLY